MLNITFSSRHVSMDEGDGHAYKEPSRDQPTKVSIWAGLVITLTFALLISILYFQIRISVTLSSFKLDYDDQKKFAVLTDLHLDLDQSDVLCRHGNDLYPHYPSSWGTQRCDTRYEFGELTVKFLVDDIVEELENFEFLFNLGDLVAHYINGYEETVDVITNATSLLSKRLSVPMYSSIGNNDMPYDYQQPENSSLFYTFLWEQFATLIRAHPSAYKKHRAQETFIKGGYYTIEHSPALQIISLNAITFSVQSNVNITEGLQQLEWLEGVIRDAQLYGRSVIIIGHDSPGMGIFDISRAKSTMSWKPEYIPHFNTILSKYYSSIKLTLFAHQHLSSWFAKELEYREIPKYASYFLLPAVSPHYQNQPSLSVGVLDNDLNLLDMLYYYCPLQYHARRDETPRYLFHYSFKARYFYDYRRVRALPLTGEVLFELASQLRNVQDMQDVYRKVLFNAYQFEYKFSSISPYQLYCIMTENTAETVKKCLETYGFK